jgi:hypothetical protein
MHCLWTRRNSTTATMTFNFFHEGTRRPTSQGIHGAVRWRAQTFCNLFFFFTPDVSETDSSCDSMSIHYYHYNTTGGMRIASSCLAAEDPTFGTMGSEGDLHTRILGMPRCAIQPIAFSLRYFSTICYSFIINKRDNYIVKRPRRIIIIPSYVYNHLL